MSAQKATGYHSAVRFHRDHTFPRTDIMCHAVNQLLMQSRFATAMAKMALIGQNSGILHDCSDVIP